MQDNVKFCKHCNTTKENTTLFDESESDFYAGYICSMKPEATSNMICPFCKNKLVETNITEEEIDILGEVSNYDRKFLEAMIDLKHEDIVEYNLKMSQFKANLSRTEEQESKTNKKKCPYCGHTEFTPVRKKWSFWAGFATNQTELICNNCGKKVE